MFDFRLKVFLTVAQRLSFTKAAQELFISQPAVSKHIKQIEQYYKAAMFERKGNTLELTATGKILKKYALQLRQIYQEMEAEINFHNEKHYGAIKIGTSTTASQYVLPKYLASFRKKYPHITLQIKTDNTEKIESLLLQNEIDLASVEGKSQRNHLTYLPFKKDEIVLCTHIDNPTPSILNDLNELKKYNFVIREKGSGTLEVIRAALHKNHLKLSELPIEIELENNESIKNYLMNSHALAFISISAILDELNHNQLKIIDIENISIERSYYFTSREGTQSPITQLFKQHLLYWVI